MLNVELVFAHWPYPRMKTDGLEHIVLEPIHGIYNFTVCTLKDGIKLTCHQCN